MNRPHSRIHSSALWTAYEYLAMGTGLSLLAGLCLLWLPLALPLRALLPKDTGQRLGRLVISFGFRIYLRLLEHLCASRFDLNSLDALRNTTPRLLIANHPSLLDAVMVISRLPNVVCVMKAGLMRNPLLGSAARLAGYIPNTGPLEVVLRAQRALGEGAHVLLFPEGSRTRSLPMDRFSATPVLIARRAQVPIQSLLIRYTSPDPRPYLGKCWPLWLKPRLPMRWSVLTDQCFEAPSDAHPASAPTDPSTLLTRSIEARLQQRLAEITAEPGSQTS